MSHVLYSVPAFRRRLGWMLSRSSSDAIDAGGRSRRSGSSESRPGEFLRLTPNPGPRLGHESMRNNPKERETSRDVPRSPAHRSPWFYKESRAFSLVRNQLRG